MNIMDLAVILLPLYLCCPVECAEKLDPVMKKTTQNEQGLEGKKLLLNSVYIHSAMASIQSLENSGSADTLSSICFFSKIEDIYLHQDHRCNWLYVI